jgi:type III secretion system YscD/HrpQ family protein
MPTPNYPFIIKVLSGLHEGAEVSLPEGDSLVGRDHHCDVILSDSNIAPEQFCIHVGSDGVISLTALTEGVYVQGREVPLEQTVGLNHFNFISMATTHLVVGPLEGEWPSLTAADAPELIIKEPAEVLSEEAQESSSKSMVTDLGDPLLDDEDSAKYPWLKLEWWKARIFMSLGAAAASILILLIVLWYALAPSSKDGTELNSMTASRMMAFQSIIEEAIRDLQLHLRLSYEDLNGRLVVRGYVATQQEVKKLTQALNALDSSIIVHIYSQEEIGIDIQKLLRQYNLPKVRFVLEEHGVVNVSGYAMRSENWESARGAILQDIPGVQSVTGVVLTGQQLLLQVSPILLNAGLDQLIKIQPDVIAVFAKGNIAESQMRTWRECRQAILQIINDRATLQDSVRNGAQGSAEQIYFNDSIVAVSVGDPSWVSLSKGQKYFKKAILPSGFTLVDITPNKILLKRGDENATIELNHS